jgi:type IV secretion system pilin
MKRIRNWIAALLFVTTAGGATVTVAFPQTTYAACNDQLLTFPAWFKGLTTGECNIKSPTEAGGLQAFIWTIALNILEVMLQLVGYISVAFIIVGGFKYMTSSGSSDGMAKARTTILNAVIGLIISIFSVAIVRLVAESL